MIRTGEDHRRERRTVLRWWWAMVVPTVIATACGSSQAGPTGSTGSPRLSISLPPPYNPVYHTAMYGPPPNTVTVKVGTVVLVTLGSLRHARFEAPSISDAKSLPVEHRRQSGCSKPKCYAYIAERPGTVMVSTQTPSGCNLHLQEIDRCAAMSMHTDVRLDIVSR